MAVCELRPFHSILKNLPFLYLMLLLLEIAKLTLKIANLEFLLKEISRLKNLWFTIDGVKKCGRRKISLDTWDGTYRSGQLAPAEVYVYILQYDESDGSPETKKGDVTLLR